MRFKYVICECSCAGLFLEYQKSTCTSIYQIACKSIFLTNTDRKTRFKAISLIVIVIYIFI